MTTQLASAGAEVDEVAGWLTTVLRPAGSLDRAARRRLSAALGHLAASCDMVIIDLTATQVAAPRALARNLRAPALKLQRAGLCLLLVGAPPDLLAELDRTAVPVITPPLSTNSPLREPRGNSPLWGTPR